MSKRTCPICNSAKLCECYEEHLPKMSSGLSMGDGKRLMYSARLDLVNPGRYGDLYLQFTPAEEEEYVRSVLAETKAYSRRKLIFIDWYVHKMKIEDLKNKYHMSVTGINRAIADVKKALRVTLSKGRHNGKKA